MLKRIEKVRATKPMRWPVYMASLVGVAMLSACGGDPETGSQPVDLGSLADAENLPLGTFSFPINELDYNFDQVLQMQYWNVMIAEGETVTAEHTWVQDLGRPSTDPNDRGTSVISPTWSTDQDVFSVGVSFTEDVDGPPDLERDMVDLTCASVSYSMFFPEVAEGEDEMNGYVGDGNMQFRFVVQDTMDRKGYFEQFTVSEIEPYLAANPNAAGWYDFGITEITMDSLAMSDDEFDLTQVDHISLEVRANGKPASVSGPFLFDNVLIEPAVVQSCEGGLVERIIVGDSFDENIDGWTEDFVGGELTYEASHSADGGNPGGAMSLDITWVNSGDDKLLWAKPIESTNITGFNIAMDIYLPEDYVVDGNMIIKMFLKDSAFRFKGFEQRLAGDLNPGWNTITFLSVEPGQSDQTDFTDITLLGVELAANGKPNSVTGAILIDNYRVYELVESSVPSNAIVSFPFETADELNGWVIDFADNLDESTVNVGIDTSQSSGAMGFNLDWTASTDKLGWSTQLAQGVDLTNKIVSVDIYLPQAYIDDSNLGMKVFCKDEAFVYCSFGWIGSGSFTTEGWRTIAVDLSDTSNIADADLSVFDMTNVKTLGIEIVANGKPADVTGTILVDNLFILDPALGAAASSKTSPSEYIELR